MMTDDFVANDKTGGDAGGFKRDTSGRGSGAPGECVQSPCRLPSCPTRSLGLCDFGGTQTIAARTAGNSAA
jgi:hypothetical protein